MTETARSRFRGVERKPVSLGAQELTHTTPPAEPGGPALVTAAVAGLRLGEWLKAQRSALDALLHEHGAVVLRGFADAADENQLRESLDLAGREQLAYRERSTPRRSLSGNVYTSTEYPADKEIELHCELTAASLVPMRVWFLCVRPPTAGGATPTADTRRLLERIPGPLADRLRAKGWQLVRHYGSGFGPDWPEAMQADSPAEVEEYCQANDIEFEWLEGMRLRTTQVRSAIERHPVTGAEVWFNHIAFWHTSSLEPSVREAMLREMPLERFPYQVFYGDGEPIDAADIQAMKDALHHERRRRDWQRGDLMVIDNLLSAHGREPYAGQRKIAVAMTDPYRRPPLAAARPE
jgi:alpha-ketoglutarate-dependent taurine dioxygenase